MRPSSKQNCKRTTIRPLMRSRRGSGIIIGVVSVFLLVSGSVLAVLLLMNTGVATYNKEKLGFIANQAAIYAATYSAYLTDTTKRQTNVSSMVSSLLTSMGLNSSNTTVTVTDTTVGAQPAVSVTVSANLPTVMAANFSSVLPQQIQSTFTAVAIKAPYATEYVVGLDPLGGKVTGLMINPTGALPNDGRPAWSIGLQGLNKIR